MAEGHKSVVVPQARSFCYVVELNAALTAAVPAANYAAQGRKLVSPAGFGVRSHQNGISASTSSSSSLPALRFTPVSVFSSFGLNARL